MRSLYIVRYKLNRGSLSAMPIYANNQATAIGQFHRRMGENGCERDKYRIDGYREIPEPTISLCLHRQQLERLTHGEWVSFIQDRAQRQTNERGRPEPKVMRLLNQLAPEKVNA